MAAATFNGFLQHLRKAMAAETLAAHPDHELIERFLTSQDEAAFHALLRRHGPMVFRVCHRVLQHEQDVEDAFQATFLVLAREARVIRKRESIASWLHGVAYRLALDARKANNRRRKHEMKAGACTCAAPLTDEVAWKELRSVFDEELISLPERLRAPLVLCYLEGLTQDEAAARLGQSKGTLRRNLERGRELLGSRLTRRGVTLSAALFAPFLSECAVSAALPPALAMSTTGAAAALAAGKAVGTFASARALTLAQGLLQPALSAKVKCVCAILLATVLAGGAALSKDAHSAPPPPPPAEGRQVAKVASIDPPAGAKADEPKVGERIEFRMALPVLHAKAQAELKLTSEQHRRIREIIDEVDSQYKQTKLPEDLSESGERKETADKLLMDKVKRLRETLPDILTYAQGLRLRQMERHAAGMSAFQDPENVKLLELTREQRDKIRTIIAEARKADAHEFNLMVQYDGFDHKKADKAAVKQIVEMLTEDQRKTWRELTGSFELGPMWFSEVVASPSLPPVPKDAHNR